MVRTNEGGSVLSFAVVGVILAILMIGGVMVVRQQAVNNQKPAPHKVVGVDKNKTATTPPSEGNKAPEPQAPAPSKSGSTTTPVPQAPTPAPNTKELPHTGPVETITTLLALGMLTASFVAYLQSRRAARLLYQLPSASI